MAEGILFDNLVGNQEYDWTAAFNNPEFIEYLLYSSNYIGTEAFIPAYKYKDVKKFISISFPNCNDVIGSHAFENCSNLQYAYFYAQPYMESYSTIAKEIDEEAFVGCELLNYVSFSHNRKIGKRAFANCKNLEYFTIRSTIYGSFGDLRWLNDIDDEAFINCGVYNSRYGFNVNIQYVNRIGKEAFANCTKLAYSFYPGRSVCLKIDDKAFSGCTNLSSIYFNQTFIYSLSAYNLKLSLGSNIFEDCTNLSVISMAGLCSILSGTLGNISGNLKSFRASWPGSYQYSSMISEIINRDLSVTIGDYAFLDFSVLSDIHVEYVNTIGSHAFENCYNLIDNYSFCVGSYMCGEISDQAFANCYNMTRIIFNYYGSKIVKCNLGHNIFDRCSKLSAIDLCGCSDIDEYTLGNLRSTLQSIKMGVGYADSSEILLHGSDWLINIGDRTFLDYSKLTSVYDCSYVNTIGEQAFKNCYSLTNCNVGNGLCNYISDEAFANCSSLNTLYLNTSAGYVYGISANKMILSGSHIFYGCDNLQNVYIGFCEEIPEYLFYGKQSLQTIYLAYANMPNINSVIYKYSVTIGEFAFADTSISYIYGNYINEIKSHAFENTYISNGFYVGNSICGKIGQYAFSGIHGNSMFYGIYINTGWQPITSGEQVQLYVDDYAFYDTKCDSILLSKVSYIGHNVFESADVSSIDIYGDYVNKSTPVLNIESITFGNNRSNLKSLVFSFINNIGSYAFESYSELTYLGLQLVNSIGEAAFKDCVNLSKINMQYMQSVPILSYSVYDPFSGISDDYTILVSSEMYSRFIDDSMWNIYSSHISTVFP